MDKIIVIRKDFKDDNPVDHAMLNYLKDISKLLSNQNFVFCINDIFYELVNINFGCQDISSYDYDFLTCERHCIYNLEITFIKR